MLHQMCMFTYILPLCLMLNYSTKQGKIYKKKKPCFWTSSTVSSTKQNQFHTIHLLLFSGETVQRLVLQCIRWKALFSTTVQQWEWFYFKTCYTFKTKQWTKSINNVIPSVTILCQNPSESKKSAKIMFHIRYDTKRETIKWQLKLGIVFIWGLFNKHVSNSDDFMQQ